MAITNRQGTRKLTKAEQAEKQRTDKLNEVEVQRSINEWRASQGLPPLKETNHEHE